ncbi:MAG: DUF3090 family protein [Sphingomonadaceae bacterium]
MAGIPNDFGPVSRLEAEAEGPPGTRTFRLLVTGRHGTAFLWLEKEELRALGMAIDQLLARVSGRPQWKLYGKAPEPYEPSPRDATTPPSVEFKVGQLSLGYETESRLFVLLVHDSDDDPEGPATFTCLASATQLRALSQRIESVISAGRPTCPLCGDPLDGGGHFCVREN